MRHDAGAETVADLGERGRQREDDVWAVGWLPTAAPAVRRAEGHLAYLVVGEWVAGIGRRGDRQHVKGDGQTENVRDGEVTMTAQGAVRCSRHIAKRYALALDEGCF